MRIIMSLQLILGGSGAGKSTYLYSSIIEESINNPDTDYIIIVPEQYTMATQKRVVELHPRKGILNIDVISFERLAYRVFEEVGASDYPVLDDTGKNLIVRRILEQHKKELRYFSGNISNTGFVAEMKSVISEMLQYDITVDKIDEINKTVDNNSLLGMKLSDINVVYSGFRNFIKDNYITSEEILDLLCRKVQESEKLKDSVIALDGFTGFTPVQYRLIGLLLDICTDIKVALTIDTSEKRAESREKMLNKMEFVDKPEILNDKMDIKLEPNVISGNDVLTVDNLTKGFDGTVLFDNICFQIKRGERVALIGSNGTGKTTILKLINGIIPADSGSIYLGAKVNIGYYDQEHHVLDPDKTIFDEIRDAYPDLNNTQIRNTLAAFLFTNEDVFKYIKDLSGGERGRVSLAKLMLSNANFLILDEPTNHLDITSKEILENALNSYTGTVLFVSHDRYFINSTATRIIELANKTVVNYIGNYDYYLEKKDILGAKPITNNTSKSSSSAISKLNWQEEKVKQAQQKKIKNEIKRTEERMALIEAEIEELDNMYADPAISSDTAKLMEIHTRKEALSKELDELYDKWGELTL